MKKFLIPVLFLSVCCIAMAAPVRSMLGSEGAEMSEEEDWENPYITDGLVAMWDGRWNIGGGMHDESAGVWIDLVSGTEIPVVNARLSFESDALRFTSLGGTASFRNNVIPLVAGSHTIEVVCRIVSMPAAPGGVAYIAVFNGNPPIRMPRIATTGDLTLYYSGSGTSSLGLNAVGGGLALHLAMATDRNAAKIYEYEGGELFRSINGGFGITNPSLYLFDGVNGSGWAAGTVLEVCCIRVYDRALIPGEVAFNYNLDKKRFNLE